MSKLLSLVLVYDWECPLSEFSFFDVRSGKSYFAEDEENLFNEWYISGISNQLDEVIDAKHPVSVYFSGSFLELLAICDPTRIKSIKSAKHINILGGTYHHSLASLYSKSHFEREVSWHQKLVKNLFGVKPIYFFNTENIYFNDLALQLESSDFKSTFAGAIDWYLGDKKNQRVFSSKSNEGFMLMLVNHDGGDTLFHDHEVVNNFMQLGSQQLEDFGGWNELIRKTKTKAELVALNKQMKTSTTETYNIRQPISAAYGSVDLDQLKNYPLQESWIKQLYGLEASLVKKPEALQKKWSRLGSIGVLKSLNPDLDQGETNNSYNVYQSLINILSDLHLKL
ncbi:Glycosyl hydrolase family 57 [Reichenbachiella faecimaris]|uniref:Glycosyl hydrolase family 57 n=1 Tax=Reichenbachiella faecimaris TaxID=692418 RepID=A0A1W2GB38_REIFA|nr:hypothetical protein [Reichenbachiella faecimaris]SMD33734.1 Glycosyl hydrolase family 57 [Reichenbachiella faecimaris]